MKEAALQLTFFVSVISAIPQSAIVCPSPDANSQACYFRVRCRRIVVCDKRRRLAPKRTAVTRSIKQRLSDSFSSIASLSSFSALPSATLPRFGDPE